MGTMLGRRCVLAWFLFPPVHGLGRDIASAGRRSPRDRTMTKKNANAVGWSALALALSVGLVACGDDDVAPPTDASIDGRGPVDAADSDAGDIDSGEPDAGAPDAEAPDAGPVDCTPTKLLVTTSDYTSGAIATYDLATGVVTVSPTPAEDQDTLPVRAGCDTYLVEGALGRVRRQVGGDALTSAVTVDIDPPGTPAADTYVSTPQVVVEAGGATYVTRLGQQSAVRIDPQAGTVLGELDFAPLAVAGDPNAVDMSTALYNGGRLLVALGRFYFPSPTFALTYAGPSVIAVVDPVSGTLTDVDAITPGLQGIELPVGNPGPIVRLDDDVVLVSCTDDAFDDTDGVLFSVDVPSGNVTATAATEAVLGGFKGLATTDDGRVFLAAGGALLELLSDTGTVLDTLVPATVGVKSFVVSGDAAYVVTDAGLRVWTLSTGTELTTAPVAFGTLPIYGIALAR
jgi:hypothetical protein